MKVTKNCDVIEPRSDFLLTHLFKHTKIYEIFLLLALQNAMFRNFGTTLETGNLKVKDEKNVEVIELIPEWLPKSDNCSDFSMTHFFQ